jgi:hypothetical protein
LPFRIRFNHASIAERARKPLSCKAFSLHSVLNAIALARIVCAGNEAPHTITPRSQKGPAGRAPASNLSPPREMRVSAPHPYGCTVICLSYRSTIAQSVTPRHDAISHDIPMEAGPCLKRQGKKASTVMTP